MILHQNHGRRQHVIYCVYHGKVRHGDIVIDVLSECFRFSSYTEEVE